MRDLNNSTYQTEVPDKPKWIFFCSSFVLKIKIILFDTQIEFRCDFELITNLTIA